MSERNATLIELTAADGLRLVAYHFGTKNPRAAVMVCCATAVRQKFYFPFARWLSTQGYSVLTLDYRGIGESLDAPTMKESKARKQDWGELDMPAALKWLKDNHPEGTSFHLVGHSAGGLLFGLMPNFSDLSSTVSIGCSTGYVNKIALPDRFVAAFLLTFFFPAMTRIFGYLPAKKLGWGEDLPTHVARQWAEWCSNPGYVSNGFGKDIKKHHYEEIKAPMLVLNVKDDPIATPENIQGLSKLFPAAPIEYRTLDQKALGLGPVGHMGFFRGKNSALWPAVTEWLQTQTEKR